jgi:hypothetical protein
MKAIESIYIGLKKAQSDYITLNQFVDKDNRKKLEYGSNPYRKEYSTLYYYWWDFQESELGYNEFRENLKEFFEKTYNEKVENIVALYIGWDKKEIGTY